MRWIASLCAVACAAATLPLAAQAPHITPQGDPSVRNDTIYALAVNPADYPDKSAAYLLDDGVVRREMDGSGSETYRQVVQILKDAAVENWAEMSFSYAPEHQRLTINWIRVVKPDGTVVSAEPTHVQDADVPASISNPVYVNRKVKRVTLAGVAVGTLVDYSYTLEELKPYLRGDFSDSWSVTTGLPTRRSRFVLDVPAAMKPRIVERNLTFKRVTKESNGRRVYTWATSDVPVVKPQLFAADSNGVYMSLSISAPIVWGDIAKWYAGLASDRYVVTPELSHTIDSLVAGAKTLNDSLRTLQRWVAQDFRYVSIDLGIGGYQPRLPADVFSTGYGDCKDKTTLFVAALKHLGITAYPVLLAAGGGVERDLPAIEQFDHAIAAVARPHGGYTFVDLTSELTPLGDLPYGPQGEFALVVHPDGSGEEVTLPEDSIATNRSEMHVIGTLSPDGIFDGRFEQSAGGIQQYALRDAFSNPLDSTARATIARKVAGGLFPQATGDSLTAFDGKNLQAPVKLSLLVHGGHATQQSGDLMFLTLPFSSMEGLGTLVSELKAEGERQFPINARAVIGPYTNVTEMRVTLPAGWRARLPKNVHAESVFGRYDVEYSQHGRELRMLRTLTGAVGTYAPDRIGELESWLSAVAQDNAKFIVLETGGQTAAAAQP
ncbi:MAG TPA: DUF3857 and transglutaminase domain-containing protein [Gemmatimonadaceae bacterium]|nr:DUF3857 and transglutaminase domain-containing protein [Gemmatimonadaceae bacterium]